MTYRLDVISRTKKDRCAQTLLCCSFRQNMFRLLEDAKEIPITVQPWTKHMPKMTQPNLDYIGEMKLLTHAHVGKAVSFQ